MDLRLGNLNIVIILGRVCADPDLRYTPSGAAVLGFRIAYDRRWLDKTKNEWQSDPSFFNVNVWGESAERLSKTLHKGSPVLVQGSLRSRSWEDKEGRKCYAVDINAHNVQNLEKQGEQAPAKGEEPEMPRDQLDDIPF